MELEREISEYIRSTPLEEVKVEGLRVYVKREDKQVTGSFKVRGVLNYVLHENPGSITVASSGNFGIATAWAGEVFDIDVNVVVPRGTPKEKKEKIEMYGAKVVEYGSTYEEAYIKASSSQDFLEPLHPRVIEGLSSLAYEVIEQVGCVDNLVLPLGTGSLMVGMGHTYKQLSREMGRNVKVFGIQPIKAPQLVKTILYGKIFIEDYPSTELEGIAGGVPSMRVEVLKKLRETVDVPLLVEDEDITPFRSMGEPTGVSGLAAIKRYSSLFHGDILTVITGGNR